MQSINGFSKFTKAEKISWLLSQTKGDISFDEFWHSDIAVQKKIDEFSENTISNFHLPFSIAPNFLINNHHYVVPMVIEESSVVAAASKAAKYWSQRGGIKAKVLNNIKLGHIHFFYCGDSKKLFDFFNIHKDSLLKNTKEITNNMDKRGGGITSFELLDKRSSLEGLFQLEVKFKTCDAMGANFINSVLEKISHKFQELLSNDHYFSSPANQIDVVMSILSNYTSDCLVKAEVSCSVDSLATSELTGAEFAKKFMQAVQIAKVDVSRAVTHNKGIFNGIDAVVLATGNDFRAIEACGHAYAAKDGVYRGLSSCYVENNTFNFSITLPLSVGTVGGLTKLHPLAKASLDILNNPSADELMMIMASVGLAQNFAAIQSLITTGIQQGHMKMHLLNILNEFSATESEIIKAKDYFSDRVVTFSLVREFINRERLH